LPVRPAGNFVNKKRLKATQAFTDSETIAALKSAVEDLASGRKKSNELEGIIAEAKALAQGWKIKEPGAHRRPLLENFSNDKTFLLAALVVALRPYYERLEPVLRLARNEFENASFVAGQRRLEEVAAYVAAHGIAGVPKPTAKQKHEVKRRFSFPSRLRSIEYEFGEVEAERRKQGADLNNLPALDLGTPAGHQAPRVTASEPACLDDILVGQTVNMQRLEDLFFPIERHHLGKILEGVQKRRYDYLAVAKIMDSLLKKRPHMKRKRASSGRPPRKAWLNDADLRVRVLTGIEARIATIAAALRESNPDIAQRWQREIADRFLSIVHRHLPDSGKK
jgi:hypothetical protein